MSLISVIPQAPSDACQMQMASPAVQIPSPAAQMPKERIRVQLFSDPCPPAEVVQNLASIEGPVDVYCWYEGPKGLLKSCALFMQKSIFEPLFYARKKDTKLCLYSLKEWDFSKNITMMSASNSVGEALNRINRAFVECIYSSAFFQYCAQVAPESAFYTYLNEELPKKEWLRELSAGQREKGIKVAAIFNNQSSLFDCIKDWDVSAAYSLIQYVEGYYLIQKSIRNGLLKGQSKIEIVFVLPNDEGKYYFDKEKKCVDFSKDIESMLQRDSELQREFGEALKVTEINVTFCFFKYGKGKSLKPRPYLEGPCKAPKIEGEEIIPYFNFLVAQERQTWASCRDAISDINGRY